jgi:chromosome segregation ATPase
MLKNITLRDFKGLNGTFELTNKVILTGPNGCGKSALIDSYRILATGYTALGKTPAATHAMASGKTCEISGTCTDGTIVSRKFEKRGATVNQTIMVNGSEKPAKDYTPPPDLFLPAESLHPNEFLSLSGDKRAAWLSDNLKMTIAPVAGDLLPAIEGVIGSVPPDEAIDKVFQLLAEKESILKKEVELCVSNIKRLTGSDLQLPAGTLEEWQGKLKATDAALEGFTREQSANQERAKLASSKVANLAKLRDQVKQSQAKIDKGISDMESLLGRKAKIGKDFDQATVEKVRREQTALNDRAAEMRHKLTHYRTSIKTIKEKKQCPTCGTSAEQLRDTVDEWDISASQIEGELEEILTQAKALISTVHEAEQGIRNASERKQIENEIRVIDDAIRSYKSYRDKTEEEIMHAEADSEMPEVGNVEVLEAQIEGSRAQKIEATDNIRKFTTSQALAETRVKAEQDRISHDKKLDTVKDVVKDLKKSRDAFLEKATSAIIAPFRTAVSAAFKDCDAYLQIVNDKGKPEVDFGIIKAGARISFDTLSGGEKLVVLVALVAALQIARCGRPSVCLLEMAEADDERLNAVASACSAIGFDQAILATCHAPKADFNPVWKIVNMGEAL